MLVVEDDTSIAEMYQVRLRADGFRVLLVSDGEQALELATDSPPDLVLLDFRLPRMDGLEVLAKLRAHPRTCEVPVAVLSSLSDPDLVERGRTLGILAWLDKAQTMPGELAQKVADWTGAGFSSPEPPEVA